MMAMGACDRGPAVGSAAIHDGAFQPGQFYNRRAWNLLSIQCREIAGESGQPTWVLVGNPMNWNNVIIAENEQDSPGSPTMFEKL